jgi:N-acetylmuramoyl-L-alanine amidase
MFSRETPNKSIGRSGQKPEAVVIHITGGTFQSAKNWIYNSIALASYHYVISRNGKLLRAVKEENTAWHAGRITNPKWKDLKPGLNPNLYTIGIAFAGKIEEKPTILQFFTAAYLLKRFNKQFQIPIDNNHIIPHNWINGAKSCPGPNINMEFLIYLANLPLTG